MNKNYLKKASKEIRETILDNENKQARRYSLVFRVISFIIPIAYVYISNNQLLLQYTKQALANTLSIFYLKAYVLFLSITDISGLFWLIVLINFKYIREQFRNFLLGSTKNDQLQKGSSMHDTFVVLLKFMVCVFVLLCIIIFPVIIKYYLARPPITYFSYGIVISTIVSSFLIFFLVYLLPDLIIFKIDKVDTKYKYLYWIYLYKSRLIESPVIFLFGIPMLFLVLILITFTPPDSRLFYTYIGLIVSLSLLIATDLLKAYTKLVSVFNDYSNHLIKHRLILDNKFKIIQIGYGNFGSTIINTIFFDYLAYANNLKRKYIFNKVRLHNYTFFPNKALKRLAPENVYIATELSKYFEVIIDRDLELKILSRTHLIIDNDVNKFEETFSDNTFNFKYGFFSSFNYHNSIDQIEPEYNSFGILGIVSDGSNYSLWKILNYDNNPILLNTTPDPKLPVILKKLIESSVFSKNPVLITTVTNESMETQLMNKSIKCFPINYKYYEAVSIAQRLSLILSKNGISNLISSNLYIFNEKESIAYTIAFLRSILSTMLDVHLLDDFIKNHIYIYIHNSDFSSSLPSNHFPNLMYSHCNVINFDPHNNIIITKDPDTIYNILDKNKNKHSIFLTHLNTPNENLGLLIELKSVINSLQIKNSQIMTSIAEDFIDEITPIFNQLGGKVKNNSTFPAKADDFILMKKKTIANQISSIVTTCFSKSYEHESEPNSILRILQLEVCRQNMPLSLIKTIAKIKGLNFIISAEEKSVIPSFIYTFSFPKHDYEEDIFVFRADFQLTRVENIHYEEPSDVHGIISNPYVSSPFMNLFDVNQKNEINHSCNNCSLTCFPGPNAVFSPASKSESLGYLKLECKDNGSSFSLLNALSHLFYGKLEFSQEENSSKFNILYQTSNLCSSNGEYVQKFYLTEDKYSTFSPKRMHIDDIIFLEMHFSSSEDQMWHEYMDLMLKYFYHTGKFRVSMSDRASFRVDIEKNSIRELKSKLTKYPVTQAY